ncbi:hypothetical protein [Asaia sp. SF2.1]|uniref:hypothetical protein n=1 Tax=Asaia sp. SF2.1 TaxID=406101 RepID=UPI0003D2F0CC|nr:hypothetical protein [Asaia sp. SF2.1]ETC99541.1 hypothetical protein P792_03665 [Asaia sp. SF2.1]
MPSLETDIIGRVKRMGLKPSAGTALLPMFEAVMNGVHAIDDLWGKDAKQYGRVVIEVLREDKTKPKSQIVGFTITDNGIGLNSENYASFLKPDSLHKIDRGGKGIGRLGWLRIFSNIRIDSSYHDDLGQLNSRSFDFLLSERDQVVPRSSTNDAPQSRGTKVALRAFQSSYGSRCPVDPAVIRQRLMGHFMALLAAGSAPAIEVADGVETIDLRQAFADLVRHTSEEKVVVELNDDEAIELTIRHIRASKAIRSDANRKAWNWLYLTAHERAVDEQPIDDAIGLKALDDGDVYVGCVHGIHLDDHVNQERTQFIFDGDESREIRRSLLGSVTKYLDAYVVRIKEQKRKTTQDVIRQYPQFHYLNDEMETFVDSLPAGATSKEQVFSSMCINRFRKMNQAERVKKAIQERPQINAEVKKMTESYQKFVQEQQRGVLAEYVLLRKSVLDILERYIGRRDESDAHYLEEAVHDLVIPMRKTSSELEITNHNLWLLDDRLAFFSHFASDLRFKNYTSDSSLERPDVAFFYDNCFAWQEQDAGNTVVLVEFKRPGRPEYDGNNNPLTQLIDYIGRFQKADLKDVRGKVVSARLKDAAFHCYIIADMTPKLQNAFRGHAFHPTPDGDGWVGYIRNPDAFVEVISYRKLLNDAHMRNAIFFKKLGVTDIDPAENPMLEVDDVVADEVEPAHAD